MFLQHFLPFKAISSFPFQKRPLPSLQNIAYCGPDVRVFERTSGIINERKLALLRGLARGDDHLVRVRVDDQIGVMGYDDDLAPFPGLPKMGD